ncbi:SAM-dependent methyltransferase [Nocardia carnea]|uniref:SAM-dependent methyltransferase n=1 Tax=Nocardia carnea TaxID=37328 RepID=UPI002453AE0B|nr:SAM-dependent methyltransferase [Nocardia carnea]
MSGSSQGVEAVFGFDPSRAHSGRIHDVLLGAGKDAYSVDHDAGTELIERVPAFQRTARVTRAWLLRAVEYLAAEHGVRQFVELGAGYPCPPNVHEVVAAYAPDARTLYVDVDPVVTAHGRVFLQGDRTFVAQADIGDADRVIAEIRAVMDTCRPVAMCLPFVVEFLPDPSAVVDAIAGVLPRGSYVVLSHITGDVGAEAAGLAAEIYGQFEIDFRLRSWDEIAELLAGCELVEPGKVAPHLWRPPTVASRFVGPPFGGDRSVLGDVCCYSAVALLR